MKKENTINEPLKTPVSLPGRVVHDIWFDLQHIQYGWDKKTRDYNKIAPRNNYSKSDIVRIFEQLNYLQQAPIEGDITGKNRLEKRYIFYVYENEKKLKMVVDLMKNSSTIVVTIY